MRTGRKQPLPVSKLIFQINLPKKPRKSQMALLRATDFSVDISVGVKLGTKIILCCRRFAYFLSYRYQRSHDMITLILLLDETRYSKHIITRMSDYRRGLDWIYLTQIVITSKYNDVASTHTTIHYITHLSLLSLLYLHRLSPGNAFQHLNFLRFHVPSPYWPKTVSHLSKL
jgi:hypothetical protein